MRIQELFAALVAKVKAVRIRNLLADLFARIIFSFVTGMVIEMVISGMSLHQSLLSRVTNLPLVMLMARPYGIYRDWTLRKGQASVRKERPYRWVILNMFTYATFFVPQYALVLWLEGAAQMQILKASGSVALFSVLLGAAYGYWLDWCRHGLFRIRREGLQ